MFFKNLIYGPKAFFLPYVLIIVLMVSFNIVNYKSMLTTMEKHSISTTVSEIDNKTQALSSAYNDTLHIIDELDFDASLLELSKKKDLDLLDVSHITKRLNISINSLTIADNILIYLKNSDIVIDRNSCYYLKNKAAMIGSSNLSHDSFINLYFNSTYYNSYVEIENFKYLDTFYPKKMVIISSLPRGYGKPELQIIIFLNTNAIKNHLALTIDNNATSDLIFNNHYVLENNTGDIPVDRFSNINNYTIKKIENKKYMLYSFPVLQTPWQYVAAINYTNITKSTIVQKFFIYITLFLGIVICILLSLHFAAFNKKRLNRMLNLNRNQVKTINEYTPLMRTELLRKIVLNEISIDETLDYNSKYALIPESELYSIFRYDININIANEIDYANEIKLQKFIINNIVQETMPQTIYVNAGLCSICFILYSNKSYDDFALEIEYLKQITEEILISSINYNLSYDSSSIVNSLSLIPTLYLEAGNNILLNKIETDIKLSENGVYFPLDLENLLITAVSNGQLQSIDSVFDILKVSNSEESLLEYLKISIDRITCMLNIVSNSFEQKKLDTIDDYRSLLKRLASSNHKSSLFESIIKFINEHFSDPSLSRALISSAFDVSEEYISMLFKKNLGTTFLNYVDKLRIDLACQLIAEQDNTLENIALKCGFSSQITFRRTFKKVTGVLSSQYTIK